MRIAVMRFKACLNCLDSTVGFPMMGALLKRFRAGWENADMLTDSGIIKAAMNKRGYRHRRAEDPLSIRGEYVRHLQYVYSKECATTAGQVVDLVYFAADMVSEKLVIGFYRENPKIENGVYANTSRSIPLKKFTAEEVNRTLDRLIPPVKSAVT